MKYTFKRILSALLSTVMLAPLGMLSFSPSAAVPSEIKVDNLKVCALEEPLGIDRTPSFSWVVTGAGKGETQTAYQIVLSSSRELAEKGSGDVWDSGKVSSDETVDLPYEGKPLTGQTSYYWRVTVWDAAGQKADSPVARFSTGVLEAADWKGDWIGFPKTKVELDLQGTKWIWKTGSQSGGSSAVGVDAGAQYFRKQFAPAAGKTVKSAIIGFTADDKATLYFNGREISSTATWSTGGLYDATEALQAGTNTVAIAAVNTTAGYAGMAAKIQVTYTDGSKDTVVTDGSWKVSDAEAAGWEQPGFSDGGWKAPDQQVAFGQDPWGSGVSLEQADSRAAVMLRKEFKVQKEIKEAYVYICGLGFFDLSVNGKAPDDSVLNPFNTQYNKSVLYRTFDVTDLLKQGDNALGVELGNSFYNEIGGVWNWAAASWRDNPKLLFQLEIRYTDGSTDAILSDESWKMTLDGPITANSMYYGDVYDARKAMPGYNTAGFDDSGWTAAKTVAAPEGKLEAQMKEPVTRVASFEPQEIVKLGEGSWRIESPEICSGWVSLMNINQKAGDKITLTYGQKLNEDGSVKLYGGGDGEIGNWWPHAYLQQDIYYSAGGKNESYEPKFSYKGFEYIQIDGYEGDLTADDVIIYRTSNDVDIISEFESSSPLFNRLHKMMLNAMADNFLGDHCDPMLEKIGWTGDANVSLPSLMYNYDMPGSLPGWLEVMEDCFEQYGKVTVTAPTADWWIDNTPVWNTLFVYGVQNLADSFGTGSYTEEQYDVMRRYVLKNIEEIKGNGWVWHDGQLADWVAPVGGSDPNVQYNENVSEGSGIAATAYVYGTLEAMAGFADNLRKRSDAQEYRQAMERIYEAFNTKFYNAEKQIYETTTWSQIGTRTKYRQTSNLVPLAFGLVPDEYVEGVVDNLVKDIVEKDYHLDTGCVGTKYILPILCDYGHADIAYRIATQDTYPSWGFWVENGAKSTWEMWESTTRSLDHYFLGTYDEWFFSHLAGIKDMEKGYKTFTVQPYMIGDLTNVRASIDTVRGKVASEWELLEDGKARMTVTVPFGSTAQILLPTASQKNVTLDGAALAKTLPGVQTISTADGQLAVTVGSGVYTFVSAADLCSVYTLSLEAAVAEAEAYDGEAIPTLTAALEEARRVLADQSATQQQVNAARDALTEILEFIAGSPARQALREAVSASKRARLAGFYQPAAWLSYQSALTAAEKLAADQTAPDKLLQAAQTQLQTAEAALDAAAYNNLAKGKTAKASSSHEDNYWGWGIRYVTDGDRKNTGRQAGEYVGYSSALTPDKNHTEWISVDLGSVQQINAAVFYPASTLQDGKWLGYGFPVDFSVQVSADGEKWETVHTEKDYPLPLYGPLSFEFDTKNARYVRLYADSIRPKSSDGDSYRMQLSEIEVYNLPAANQQKGLLYLQLEGGVLDQVFHTDTLSYNAQVSAYVDSLTLTPYTSGGASVKIDGKTVSSGQPSAAIAVGDTAKTIRVEAAGKTYTIQAIKTPSTAQDGKKALEMVLGEATVAMKGQEYAGATASVRQAFDLAYTKAQRVYVSDTAGEAEITAAWTALLDAMHRLSLQAGDKTALNKLVERAEALKLEDYEDTGKEAFRTALEKAKAVQSDGDALQAEIDAAADALEKAVKSLKPSSIVPGDMDKDGKVTIQDVMEACKVLARKSAGKEPTEDEMARGNLDGDKVFTINDVMEICKILARKA